MSANKHSSATGVRRCRSESAGDCGRAPCPGHRGRGSPSDAGETPVVVLITQRSQVQILPPTLLPPTLPPLLLPPLPFVQFRGLSQSLGRPSRLGLALLIRVHGRSKPGVTTRALGSDRAPFALNQVRTPEHATAQDPRLKGTDGVGVPVTIERTVPGRYVRSRAKRTG